MIAVKSNVATTNNKLTSPSRDERPIATQHLHQQPVTSPPPKRTTVVPSYTAPPVIHAGSHIADDTAGFWSTMPRLARPMTDAFPQPSLTTITTALPSSSSSITQPKPYTDARPRYSLAGVTRCQAVVRGYLARRRFHHMVISHRAAVKIQALW